MSMKCKSCANMALPKIERNSCGENFGQAQIVAFVDLNDSTTLATLTTSAVATQSTWTALMAGAAPKVVISPMLYNPASTPGGERTWGGGNATPDGRTFSLGKDPSEFTAELRKATASQQKSMEELSCMAEAGRLGCFVFDGDAQVMGVDGDTVLKPIKVQRLFVSDLSWGTNEEPDYNSMSMQFEEGWSADRKVVSLTGWRGADLILATVSQS